MKTPRQRNEIPLSEIEQRIARIQKEMRENGTEGMLVIQRADLFYFSGTAQNGCLFIPAEGEPLLLVRKYMPRAEAESPLRRIVEIRSVKEIPRRIAEVCGKLPRTLAFEWDVMPVREFRFYQTLFPEQEHQDGSPMIHRVRMIKSPWEIGQMEKLAELSAQTFEYTRTHIRAGYTEIEFAGMIETFARKIGHGARLRVRDYQAEIYLGHILSGKSGGMVGLLDSPATGEGTSAAFPCSAGNKRLAPDEPIMIDFCFVSEGYHIDETRMFAIGSMPEKAMKICQAAMEIHDEVLECVKPGVRADELFRTALSAAESKGYAEQFLGPPGYKVRFVGHGVGIELVEPPFIAAGKRDRLEPGMIFALEPKMVFENEFCAGVESVFLVTETGHRGITRIPQEVFVC